MAADPPDRHDPAGRSADHPADPPHRLTELPPPRVIDLLDQLAGLASAAPRVPWSSRAVVDAEELATIVTELKSRLPNDLAEARAIVAARADLLADAEIAARDLLSEAEAEAERLTRQHVVTQRAERRAAMMLDEAKRQAAELKAAAESEADDLLREVTERAERQRREADAYSLDVLRRLENHLTGFVVTVRKGIDALERPEN